MAEGLVFRQKKQTMNESNAISPIPIVTAIVNKPIVNFFSYGIGSFSSIPESSGSAA